MPTLNRDVCNTASSADEPSVATADQRFAPLLAWNTPTFRRLSLADAEIGPVLPSADGVTGKDFKS